MSTKQSQDVLRQNGNKPTYAMVVQGRRLQNTTSPPEQRAPGTPMATRPGPDPVLDAVYTLLGLTSQARRTQCSPIEYSVTAAPAPWGVQSGFGRFYQITRRTPCMGPGTQSMTVRMKIDDKGHVVAWKDRGWVDFGDWVSVFPPLRLDPIGLGSTLWKHRYLWHRSGKCFRLLSFPRELRDMVYQACATFHYMSPDFEGEWGMRWNALPYSDYAGPYLIDELLTSEYGPRGTLVRTEREDGGRILNGAVCPLSLLLLNKQVSREFKEAMWKTLDFRFPASQASSDVIWGGQRLARAVSNYTALSRITLELPILDWIKLLGIPLRQQPTDHWREFGQLSPIAQLLQTMNLSHLTIYIHHQVGYLADRRYKNADSPLYNACPHVLVGYIIIYASTVFSMVPHVQVMGCISSRMAAQFQQLHQERHTGATPTLTQWDIIGPSSYLKMVRRSWMDHGLYTLDPMEVDNHTMCVYLGDGEEHDCYCQIGCKNGDCMLQRQLGVWG